MRSLPLIVTLVLTAFIGCSSNKDADMDALFEEAQNTPDSPDVEEFDTAILDTDTEDTASEDTGDTSIEDSGEISGDPCSVSLRWAQAYAEVSMFAFGLPDLQVRSTCETEIGLRGIGLKFMGGSWIGDLPDSRLGIVDGDEQQLGPYDGTISEDNIMIEWSANVDSHGVYFSPEQPVDLNFEIVAFTSAGITEIHALMDETPDVVSVQATILYNADGHAGGALVDTMTLVIARE